MADFLSDNTLQSHKHIDTFLELQTTITREDWGTLGNIREY